ncbi:ricin-type beta-trefoil lectin domain protein [Streptomyces sp. NPDC096323]|uniref:RICIN domain-containing protein n=1 Tax=Streptomyces sp. NPDC096323 TaxID=3155822 RepID=UPI0033300AAA
MSSIPIATRPPAARRSRAVTVAALVFALIASYVTLVSAAGGAGAVTRGQQVMYTPPSNAPAPGALYAHGLQLKHSGAANGQVLATFEQYTNGTPVFPIFRSTDGGATFSHLSDVRDTQNGWGLRWQPHLFELPVAVGGFPAGTLLIAGDSIPGDLHASKIDMYASTDHGVTWRFVSNIATGGPAYSVNGYTPVWEPFFLMNGSRLVVYYSDQRDLAHGQKVVHQVSTNGVNWGPVVDDVAQPNYGDRPGMPTVVRLPNGNYVMTYEYGGAREGNFTTYYKIAANPEGFGSVAGIPLRTTDGIVPCCTPYIEWSPAGGPNGTLIVTSLSSDQLFLNTQNGAANTWTHVSSLMGGGYSRGLVPLSDGHSVLVLSGGGNGSGLNNVWYSTVDLGGGGGGAETAVRATNANRCLDVPDRATANGSLLDIWDCNGGTNQQWSYTSSTGELRVYGNKCLDVPKHATTPGTRVDIWDCNGGPNQQWTLNPDGTIVGRESGLCLDVAENGTANGTAVDIWTCNGGSNQKWTRQ